MSRTYFNQQAAIWDEIISEKDTSKLERMVERLSIKPGSTLLDVGTGTGVLVPFLLSRIGKDGQLVALDIAEQMLQKARAKAFDGNIYYLQADITSLPLCEEFFDIVVCYSSFPHFQDKPRALNEIKRVTKNGGRLLICHTSSRDAINDIHRQIPTVQNDILPDETEMQIIMSTAGFTDIEIEDGSETYLAGARKPALE